MIVRSDIITRQDICDAVDAMNANVYFIYQETPDRYMTPIREFTPRNRKHGYEFFLAGSHTSASNHDRDHKAATWVEWGIIIDRLFKIDPNAQIGHYHGKPVFLHTTAREVTQRGLTREQVPWLNV